MARGAAWHGRWPGGPPALGRRSGAPPVAGGPPAGHPLRGGGGLCQCGQWPCCSMAWGQPGTGSGPAGSLPMGGAPARRPSPTVLRRVVHGMAGAGYDCLDSDRAVAWHGRQPGLAAAAHVRRAGGAPAAVRWGPVRPISCSSPSRGEWHCSFLSAFPCSAELPRLRLDVPSRAAARTQSSGVAGTSVRASRGSCRVGM